MRSTFSFPTIGHLDWWLIGPVFGLVMIGLGALYSVDASSEFATSFVRTHSLALLLGVGAAFVGSQFNRSIWQSLARPLYILALISLVLVLFFGATVRGTTGWFRFGGASFQPVELAKVAVVLILAWWMYRYNRRFTSWQFVVSSAFLAGLPILLVLAQPDMGSALLIGGIWSGLLLVGRVRRLHLITLALSLIIFSVLAWIFLLAPYQKARVQTFFDPSRDPLGSGYNVTQSIIAIGSGGIWGHGLGAGTQSQLHFLPEAQTDFIFSVIGEELGLVGTLLVLIMYGLLLGRLVLVAKQAQNDFSGFLLFGTAILWGGQALVNIGGTLGLLPVTGVTLPFVSYGGSSILLNFCLLGAGLALARETSDRAKTDSLDFLTDNC